MSPASQRSFLGRHANGLIALLLGLVAFGAIVLHAPRVGTTRDEGFYFSAAKSYAGWFRDLGRDPAAALSEPVIRRYYENNREHPVLIKNLMALSALAFSETEPSVPRTWPSQVRSDYVMAMRLPAQALSALAVSLIFLLGTALAGRRVGLLAAAMFFLIPRHFFHSQLACFDMPAVTVWLATIMAYRRARDSWRWAIACGLIWGLALATKHNSFFIPIVLLLHWLVTSARDLSLSRTGLRLPRIPLAFFAMLALGPLVFIGHWPFLWHQTIERIAWYFGFHLNHVHYPWEYFGTLLTEPPFPWLYPFALTAVTCPLPTLVLGGLGFFAVAGRLLGHPLRSALRALARLGGLRTGDEAPAPEARLDPNDGWLLVINAFVPLAVIALPSVPIFGGVKHWMHAMPFFCILGAMALDRSLTALPARIGRVRLPRRAVFAGLSLLILLPSLQGLIFIGGYGTSFYNSLIGGVAGAADQGMQRQYWSNNVTGVLPWIDENLPQNARVHFHELTQESMQAYKIQGQMRPDLRMSWVLDHGDFTVFQYHREFVDTEFRAWNFAADKRVLHGLYLDEVPIILIYDTRR